MRGGWGMGNEAPVNHSLSRHVQAPRVTRLLTSLVARRLPSLPIPPAEGPGGARLEERRGWEGHEVRRRTCEEMNRVNEGRVMASVNP